MSRTDTEPTVLIVEDDQETADLFTAFLAGDHAVRTAYSGEDALESMDADVDVVLLDRKLPGISGDEVLERIRARDFDCRVVMVTAVDPDTEVLDLPFDDYLVKPVSRETIRDVVSAMLVRNTRDEKIQEIVALASKMATIESKLSISELEASSAYAAVEARFDELRAETDLGHQADDVYAGFTVDKIRAVFAG